MLDFQGDPNWKKLNDKIHLGKLFCFVENNLLEGTDFQWLTSILGLEAPAGARILPLWSTRPVALPGATHPGAKRRFL